MQLYDELKARGLIAQVRRRAQDAGIAISALSPVFSGMVHRPHLLWHERNDGDTLLRWVMALFVYVFHEEKEGPTFQYPTS